MQCPMSCARLRFGPDEIQWTLNQVTKHDGT